MKLITEVATPKQTQWAIEKGFDALWLGARTTVSPLQVEEIFQAMRGEDVPVFIKNPITPDLNLWFGAIERARLSGIEKIFAVHRGFNTLVPSSYRYLPIFEFAWKFHHQMPEIPLLCDPCHMSGQAGLVPAIVEWCKNTIYDGFMIEVHPYPKQALSDPRQQLDARVFRETFKYRMKVPA
jgi:chorismate mutase